MLPDSSDALIAPHKSIPTNRTDIDTFGKAITEVGMLKTRPRIPNFSSPTNDDDTDIHPREIKPTTLFPDAKTRLFKPSPWFSNTRRDFHDLGMSRSSSNLLAMVQAANSAREDAHDEEEDGSEGVLDSDFDVSRASVEGTPAMPRRVAAGETATAEEAEEEEEEDFQRTTSSFRMAEWDSERTLTEGVEAGESPAGASSTDELYDTPAAANTSFEDCHSSPGSVYSDDARDRGRPGAPTGRSFIPSHLQSGLLQSSPFDLPTPSPPKPRQIHFAASPDKHAHDRPLHLTPYPPKTVGASFGILRTVPSGVNAAEANALDLGESSAEHRGHHHSATIIVLQHGSDAFHELNSTLGHLLVHWCQTLVQEYTLSEDLHYSAAGGSVVRSAAEPRPALGWKNKIVLGGMIMLVTQALIVLAIAHKIWNGVGERVERMWVDVRVGYGMKG